MTADAVLVFGSQFWSFLSRIPGKLRWKQQKQSFSPMQTKLLILISGLQSETSSSCWGIPHLLSTNTLWCEIRALAQTVVIGPRVILSISERRVKTRAIPTRLWSLCFWQLLQLPPYVTGDQVTNMLLSVCDCLFASAKQQVELIPRSLG